MPADASPGYNFLQHPANDWLTTHWMFRRLVHAPHVRRHFLLRSPEIQDDKVYLPWNKRAVFAWARQLRTIKEQLLLAVHLTGGGPARGMEIVTVRHHNDPETGQHRGILLDAGKVAFVTSYHKGFVLSQRAKIIHRYLPLEVGELVAWYLWLVEPFVRVLQSRVYQTTVFSSYLWQPQPDVPEDEHPSPVPAANLDGCWHTDRIRFVMTRETTTHRRAPPTVAMAACLLRHPSRADP